MARPQVLGTGTACNADIEGETQWRTEGVGGLNPPPPTVRGFDKSEPNFQFRGIYIRNNLIRIWVSFICKLSGTPD
jgi:hypothetical protein